MDTPATPAEIDEARVLVLHIASHQRALGVSDVALVKRYPALGSARTWRTRLVAGAWGELRLEAWLAALRGVMNTIEAEPAPAGFQPGVPCSEIHRHIDEADRAQADGHWDVAIAHLAAARREVSRMEKELSEIPAP